jgi:hypothetical protein
VLNWSPYYDDKEVIAISKESSGLEESKKVTKEKEERADEGKRRHPAHFPETFQRFLVPQKASVLERKSLVAQGTLESHPYRRAPFRLILRPIFRVRKSSS